MKTMQDVSHLDYESVGDIEPEGADPSNIPVAICIHPPGDADNPDGTRWLLRADNFMPCKSRVGASAYEVYAASRDTLMALIRRCWLPLYQTAVEQLAAMPEDDMAGSFVLIRWCKRDGTLDTHRVVREWHEASRAVDEAIRGQKGVSDAMNRRTTAEKALIGVIEAHGGTLTVEGKRYIRWGDFVRCDAAAEGNPST